MTCSTVRAPRRLTRLAAYALFAIAFAASTVNVHAHDFCVSTAQQLQNALDAVSDGGTYVNEDNGIEIVEGTYRTGSATGGDAFHSTAMTTTGKLAIFGGYTAGCTIDGMLVPASKTILDAHGISGAMRLDHPHGNVSFSELTFRNGEGGAGAGGLDINDLRFTTITGTVVLDHLIFLDNHSSGNAGGLNVLSGGDAGFETLQLHSALFAGNRSDHNYGAANLFAQSGSVIAYSLTVVDNQSPVATTGGLSCGGNADCKIIGSIFRGNTNFGLTMAAHWNGVDCSDYGTLGGHPLDEDTDNLSVAPSFVDANNGDYHLSGHSPLLARCWPNFANDLDNNPFPRGGRSDMGAYEETVFIDGFEPSI